MNELVGDYRDKYANRAKVLAALRARWYSTSHPHSHMPSLSYLLLLDELGDKITDVISLVEYARLYGFNIHHSYLSYTTPLLITTCPQFQLSIPTQFFSQTPEYYKCTMTVNFAPPCAMLLTTGDDVRQLTKWHVVTWSVGDMEYRLEGSDRVITVIGQLESIVIPTRSSDVILPLGVVYEGGELLKPPPDSKLVRQVGSGYVAWQECQVDVVQGAMLTRVRWVASQPLRRYLEEGSPLAVISTYPLERINWLLLRDLHDLLDYDMLVTRVEGVLWNGCQLLDRAMYRSKDGVELKSLVGKKIDVAALLQLPMVARCERDYRLWRDAYKRWNS